MNDDALDHQPNEIKLSDDPIKFKWNKKGVLAAIVRTAMDVGKSSLGAGTIPEWIKALELKSSKEKQAFTLIAFGLINGVKAQLKYQIPQVYLDEKKNLYYEMNELKFDVFNSLENEENEYHFNCDFLSTPEAIPLIQDFKKYYREWLEEAFLMSTDHLEIMLVEFPQFFANSFFSSLANDKGQYLDLLKWCNDPITEDWKISKARNRYKSALKQNYHLPALGEQNVALSDVYIEPSFLVFDKILSEEKRKKIKEKFKIEREQHFLPIDFAGSIHDYLLNHFIPIKKSESIDASPEESRILILLGQPGHGKSSFCYRSMNDLLRKSDFNGNAFFIRLQNVGKDILNNPLEEITKWAQRDEAIDFQNWIDPKFQQKNILFLDGLDEMYMTQSLTDNEVLTFINNLKSLLHLRKNLYFVITSRFNYVETSKLYNGDCLLFSLDTLNEQQQLSLVEKYQARNPEQTFSFNAKLIQKCNEEDSQLKHIKELIELPIILQMILISGVNIQENQSRATIYDRLFKTVLDRKWDKEKKLKKYKEGVKIGQFREYLSFLAYKIFQNNRGYLHKSEIEKYPETKGFKRRVLNVELDDDDMRPVLKDILTSFYLKESLKAKDDQTKEDRENDYAVEFLHKSLYEYLACEYLWTEVKDFFLKEDKYGSFQEYGEYEVMKKVQELFANIKLSKELMGYLGEIMEQDTEETHSFLTERMGKYLPRLLKLGFLYELKRPETPQALAFTPELQVLNCFHGYWTIFGQLNQRKIRRENYFDSSWEEFSKRITETNKKEMIDAFKEKNKNIGENLSEITRAFRKVNEIREHLNEEANEFTKYLRGGDSINIDGKQLIRFQNWIRNYFYIKAGTDIYRIKIMETNKEKKHWINLLKILGSAEYSMFLNCNFLELNNINLSRLYAPEIILNGALLSNTTLINTDLSNAGLSSADLSSTYLSSADLSSTDLSYTDLRNAYLNNANLIHANLSYANLSYANLFQVYLIQANLWKTNLRNTNLRRAYLSSADLSYADLSYANLDNADLTYADLTYADLSSANLSYTNLNNADLSSANLNNVDLSYANLFQANLNNADLRNAGLSNAKIIKKDWIKSLKKQGVKGAEEIEKRYIISAEKEEFMNKYGEKFHAYVITLKK